MSTEAEHASLSLRIDELLKQPVALQRRLIRAAAEQLGIATDVLHVNAILHLAESNGKSAELPGGWCVKRTFRELQFERASHIGSASAYSYSLVLPGEVFVPELKGRVRGTFSSADARYNSAQPAPLVLDHPSVKVRNWRAGDRYHPAHARSEKKVKELLQSLSIPLERRGSWPVVECGGQLLWVKDVRQRAVMLGEQAVRFEFLPDEDRS